eukprot:44746-Amphidinium_carterae.1
MADKQTYKQHHFHDFSIITSDKDMDEEYAKLLITEYSNSVLQASEIEERQASARKQTHHVFNQLVPRENTTHHAQSRMHTRQNQQRL